MALKLTGASHCIPDYTSMSIIHAHLACCQTTATAKLRPQKLQTQTPPWVTSLFTSNSPEKLINVSQGGFDIHL